MTAYAVASRPCSQLSTFPPARCRGRFTAVTELSSFEKFHTELDNQIPDGLDVHLICDDHYTPHVARDREIACCSTSFPYAPHLRPDLLVLAQSGRAMVRDFGPARSSVGGAHRSLPALERDIRDWITNWNDNPKPFTWTKTADEIGEPLAAYIQRIPGAGH